jgi:DNA-binding response OmpR family regulator
VVQRGTETILLLEDNPVLQQLMAGALQERGYSVIMTSEGSAALQTFEQHAASIALVIADVKTPKMTGTQLYEHLRRGGSPIRFLFVSGYQEREVSQHVMLDKNSAFLEKPFHLGELVTKVRELLGRQEAIGNG